MALILLVEDDVRTPGGLQGDLEYIQFSRQSPEKSFGKILEMIKALLPKAKLVEASISEKTKIAEEKPEEKPEEKVLIGSHLNQNGIGMIMIWHYFIWCYQRIKKARKIYIMRILQ